MTFLCGAFGFIECLVCCEFFPLNAIFGRDWKEQTANQFYNSNALNAQSPCSSNIFCYSRISLTFWPVNIQPQVFAASTASRVWTVRVTSVSSTALPVPSRKTIRLLRLRIRHTSSIHRWADHDFSTKKTSILDYPHFKKPPVGPIAMGQSE